MVAATLQLASGAAAQYSFGSGHLKPDVLIFNGEAWGGANKPS